jgi:hypothetical protein
MAHVCNRLRLRWKKASARQAPLSSTSARLHRIARGGACEVLGPAISYARSIETRLTASRWASSITANPSMSPKTKSKRRTSKQARQRSRSKAPSRRSTPRRGKGSGRAGEGCAVSGPEESTRRKQGALHAPDAPEEKKRQRRRRLKKRVHIGEALRREGLDERTIAGTYAQVVDDLKGTKKAGSNQKLLVEILKECTRQIEAAQPVGDGGSGTAGA